MTDDIITKALRLKELDKLIIKSIATVDMEHFLEYISEFHQSKKDLRSYALEHPVVNLHDIENVDARFIIQKIMSGEPFPVEKAITNSSLEEFLKGELDDNDLDELGKELFYSWFSHYEYISGLYEIGALTISCGTIPAHLSKVVDEARHCYTFQQFNAVFSLCRTMLEVCVNELVPKGNVRTFPPPTLEKLIDQLCDNFTIPGGIRNQLHKVRRLTNPVVHGKRLVDRDEAKDTLKKTLSVINQLYQYNK